MAAKIIKFTSRTTVLVTPEARASLLAHTNAVIDEIGTEASIGVPAPMLKDLLERKKSALPD